MYYTGMGFYEDLLAGIRRSIDEKFDGKPSRLAKAAGTHPSTLSRLIEGERQKWLLLIARIADCAEVSVARTFPPEQCDGGTAKAENIHLKKELADAEKEISGLKGQLVGMEQNYKILLETFAKLKIESMKMYDPPGRPKGLFDSEDRENAREDDTDYGMVQEEPGTYGITNGDDSFGNDKR